MPRKKIVSNSSLGKQLIKSKTKPNKTNPRKPDEPMGGFKVVSNQNKRFKVVKTRRLCAAHDNGGTFEA